MLCGIAARVDTDGGEKVQQLTGQLHDLNMQLSQLKDENIQLETQHSTSLEEVKTPSVHDSF